MKYLTENNPNKIVSTGGKQEKTEYERTYNQDGSCYLKKIGTRNIYLEIQEAGEGRTIQDIISEAKDEKNLIWGDLSELRDNKIENINIIEEKIKNTNNIINEINTIENKLKEKVHDHETTSKTKETTNENKEN